MPHQINRQLRLIQEIGVFVEFLTFIKLIDLYLQHCDENLFVSLPPELVVRSYPTPESEAARLSALESLRILDTPSEDAFDRIARLAANYLDVPIALVTFIESERQWFKAAVGVSTREHPREFSFCAHAIMQSDPLIVSNALLDGRFASNPLVTSPDGVRFYAGFPLEVYGEHRVGTLAVVDYKPRQLTAAETAFMIDLSKITVDATYYRIAQQHLRKENKTLESENKDYETLMGILGHDLISPVNALVGFSDLVCQKEILSPSDLNQQKDFIRRINCSARLLKKRICGVINYARLRASENEVSSSEAALTEVVEEYRSVNPEVYIKIQGQLPLIEIDPEYLKSIFSNLIQNAIKYRSDRKPIIEISAGSNSSSEYHTFSVSDNGIGIPEKRLDVVFQIFKQLNPNAEGIGMGLSFVKRMIENAKGQIWLESIEGEGTTVFFTLPLSGVRDEDTTRELTQ